MFSQRTISPPFLPPAPPVSTQISDWLATSHPRDEDRTLLAARQSYRVALQGRQHNAAWSTAITLDVLRAGGKLTAPGKRSVVMRCIREAAGADARVVVAMGDSPRGRAGVSASDGPI